MIMYEPRAFARLRGTLLRNAPLARHTTWRVGGPADLLYAPADRDSLEPLIPFLAKPFTGDALARSVREALEAAPPAP